MKTTIRKWFLDTIKEEDWLNEMARHGYALVYYSPFTYVFEDCQPGEYIYRTELLEDYPRCQSVKKYLGFMEENGVECVSTYYKWAYFRRKASDGNFELYSDTHSKIAQYQRIINLYWLVGLLEVTPIIINMFIVLIMFDSVPSIVFPMCIISLLPLSLIIILIILGARYQFRIRDIRKTNAINE